MILAALLALPAPATLTLAEARTMDHAALARRVLGDAGDRYVESRIIIGEGGFRGVWDGLDAIEFATIAKPEHGGLCRVERLTVRFEKIDYKDRRKDPPVAVSALRTEQLWAHLPLAGTPGDDACRKLGAALEAPQNPGPYFVANSGTMGRGGPELYPMTITAAMQLLRNFIAIQGAGVDFVCSGELLKQAKSGNCVGNGAIAAKLDIARLSRVEVRKCPSNAELCISFGFADPSSGEFQQSGVVLNMRTDTAADAQLGDKSRVIRATLGTEYRVV